MVEPILYASLGALVATLLGLMFLPFFWRRAVRLTVRRLIDRLPVSAGEIVAAQDRLRAEVAMSMRETERKAEAAITEATRDRVESARARATELGHLADLADLRSQIAFLEAEGVKVRGERDKSGAAAAAAYSALEEARAAASRLAQELQAARQDASASRAATEQARIEAAEREAEVAALRAKITMLGGGAAKATTDKAAEKPAGPPRLPHVDRQFEEGVDPASLAALRRRLDEVADQIVKAAETPSDPKSGGPRGDGQSDQARAAEPTPLRRRFMPKIAARSGA